MEREKKRGRDRDRHTISVNKHMLIKTVTQTDGKIRGYLKNLDMGKRTLL